MGRRMVRKSVRWSGRNVCDMLRICHYTDVYYDFELGKRSPLHVRTPFGIQEVSEGYHLLRVGKDVVVVSDGYLNPWVCLV